MLGAKRADSSAVNVPQCRIEHLGDIDLLLIPIPDRPISSRENNTVPAARTQALAFYPIRASTLPRPLRLPACTKWWMLNAAILQPIPRGAASPSSFAIAKLLVSWEFNSEIQYVRPDNSAGATRRVCTWRPSGIHWEGSFMRLTILILMSFLFMGVVSWAQTSSSPEASPAAMASSHPPGMAMEQPPASRQPCPPCFGPYPQHRRSVRIVFLVLRVLLALSGIFALTALGIFLIRRSRSAA